MIQVVYNSSANRIRVDWHNILFHLIIVLRVGDLRKPYRYYIVTPNGRMPRKDR